MPWSASRRTVLAGGLGALALAGTGVGLVAAHDPTDAITRTLHRLLGEFRIAREDMRRFALDYLEVVRGRGMTPLIVDVFGLADEVLESEALRRRLPDSVLAQVERYERHLITHFTLGTTFFAVRDPHRDPIVYLGPDGSCRNPFARFA